MEDLHVWNSTPAYTQLCRANQERKGETGPEQRARAFLQSSPQSMGFRSLEKTRFLKVSARGPLSLPS